MSVLQVASVYTHGRPEETREALATLLQCARDAGVTLRFSAEETRKQDIQAADGLEPDSDSDEGVGICIVLGGDGTILMALRRYARTGVPVFAVNFGEIGFLATVDDPADAAMGFQRAFSGDYEFLELPVIALSKATSEGEPVNDISVTRKPGGRVANLAYAVGDNEIGRVRCDGLVVATPAGSTGYNLANGGPVMAWGVEGYVVSFIAPHSLTARSLVVGPDDPLSIRNCSRGEAVDVSVDGRPACELGAGESIELSYARAAARLAQIQGTSFYHRLREKFGRLAS